MLSCLGKRGLAMNVLRVIIFSIITFFVGLLIGRHDRDKTNDGNAPVPGGIGAFVVLRLCKIY